jgi:hypothetical protein
MSNTASARGARRAQTPDATTKQVIDTLQSLERELVNAVERTIEVLQASEKCQ